MGETITDKGAKTTRQPALGGARPAPSPRGATEEGTCWSCPSGGQWQRQEAVCAQSFAESETTCGARAADCSQCCKRTNSLHPHPAAWGAAVPTSTGGVEAQRPRPHTGVVEPSCPPRRTGSGDPSPATTHLVASSKVAGRSQAHSCQIGKELLGSALLSYFHRLPGLSPGPPSPAPDGVTLGPKG